MSINALRKKIIINFLHYAKGFTLLDANKAMIDNEVCIDTFFNLVGEDILINLLKEINKKK
jgi:hypothetical protein